MKYVFYFAIVILALTRIHAQQGNATATNASKVAHDSSSPGALLVSDRETNQATSAELLLGYAATVDRLLRNVADQMRLISEEVDLGELNPLEALALKLETTRAMIARLETVSAVYDAVILSSDDADDSDNRDDEVVPGNSSAATVARIALRRSRTISVKELLREPQ